MEHRGQTEEPEHVNGDVGGEGLREELEEARSHTEALEDQLHRLQEALQRSEESFQEVSYRIPSA